MQTINLSNEKKFIYIGSTLYPLKGVLIAPIEAERTTCPATVRGNLLYRTLPIVGEDWQVVDDSWCNFESEYGFRDYVLDASKGPVSVSNLALTCAMDESTCELYVTPWQMLHMAKNMGIEFTNKDLSPKIEVNVRKSFKDGLYYIGNSMKVYDDFESQGSSHVYVMPDHMFSPTAEKTYFDQHLLVNSLSDLLFRLKRQVGAYTDFFRTKKLSLSVTFDENVPSDVKRKVRTVINKVNNYLRYIDDINQYE